MKPIFFFFLAAIFGFGAWLSDNTQRFDAEKARYQNLCSLHEGIYRESGNAIDLVHRASCVVEGHAITFHTPNLSRDGQDTRLLVRHHPEMPMFSVLCVNNLGGQIATLGETVICDVNGVTSSAIVLPTQDEPARLHHIQS